MKYAIINTIDAPCKRMVCECVNGKYYYMMRSIEPHLKSFDGMTPDRPTRLEDFGFEITESEHEVHFKLVRPSVATYEDGVPRAWQDIYKTNFVLPKVILRKKRAQAAA